MISPFSSLLITWDFPLPAFLKASTLNFQKRKVQTAKEQLIQRILSDSLVIGVFKDLEIDH
jgi:hypothetical protein